MAKKKVVGKEKPIKKPTVNRRPRKPRQDESAARSWLWLFLSWSRTAQAECYEGAGYTRDQSRKLCQCLPLIKGREAIKQRIITWIESDPVRTSIYESFSKHYKVTGFNFLFDAAPLEYTCPGATRTTTHIVKGHNPYRLIGEKEAMKKKTLNFFKIKKDPFSISIASDDDIYFPESFQDVYDEADHVARTGGFLAVIGESGAGKTVIRQKLETDLEEEGVVVVIRPQITDQSQITSNGLMASIIADITKERLRMRSGEAMAREAKELLLQRVNANRRNLLIIDDAQMMTKKMLYTLKSLAEMSYKYKPLLGIILFGQPELSTLLDTAANYDLRQTAWRITPVDMPVLNGSSYQYLDHKLSRVGVDINKIITKGAVKMIDERVPGLHPLIFHVAVVKCMNYSAQYLNAPEPIDEDIVAGALRGM